MAESHAPQRMVLEDAFGLEALAYLCACDVESMIDRLSGKASLTTPQESVLKELELLVQKATVVASQGTAPASLYLSQELGRYVEPQQASAASLLRASAGGDISTVINPDPVIASLVHLLRDAFALILLPAKDGRAMGPLFTAATWTDPHRRTFESAVLSDPDLSRLFPGHDSAKVPMILRSTGSGGSLQLELFADLLLAGVWWRGQLRSLDWDTALAHLSETVDLIRKAARGEDARVPALVAFHGVVFDPEVVGLPFGELRGVTDRERAHAPLLPDRRVSFTDEGGETVAASYAGDVVLETTMPFRIRVGVEDPANLSDWPAGLDERQEFESWIETVQLAGLLMEGQGVPYRLVPTWRRITDPLGWGPVSYWNDPERGPASSPRRLRASRTRAGRDAVELKQPPIDQAERIQLLEDGRP